MERYRLLLGGVLLAVVPLSLMTGFGGMVPLLVGLVAVGGLAFSANRVSLRGASDVGWAPTGAFAFVPSATRGPSPAARVTAALGRVEARQLLQGSLACAVGLGFLGLQIILFGFVWAGDHGGEVARLIALFPIMVHPFAGMVVVAAHRARTRGRRDGVEELFGACPMTEAARTAAHLRSAWVAAASAVVAMLAMLGVYSLRAGTLWGPLGARQAAEILACGVLGAGAVALGVALARWLPWQVVPIVAVVVVGFLSLGLVDVPDGGSDGRPQLATFTVLDDVDIRFTAPHWLAHHLWLVALAVAVAAFAVLRERSARRLGVAVLGAASIVAIVTAVLATRPMTNADANRIAALINDPAAHQTCVDVGIPVCTYAGDHELVDVFAGDIAAVLSGVPASEPPPTLRLRQGVHVDRADLDPAVAALVPAVTAFDDGTVLMSLRDSTANHDAVRFWVALAVTGIQPDPSSIAAGQVADVRGQARGVVAIWLATSGRDGGAARRMSSVDGQGPDDHDHEPWRPWPDPADAGSTPVVWALTDLIAARAVQGLPDAEVAAVVSEQWPTLLDPATTTDDLLAALGLAPVGPPDGSTPVHTG
jgi:hypothetical protein